MATRELTGFMQLLNIYERYTERERQRLQNSNHSSLDVKEKKSKKMKEGRREISYQITSINAVPNNA